MNRLALLILLLCTSGAAQNTGAQFSGAQMNPPHVTPAPNGSITAPASSPHVITQGDDVDFTASQSGGEGSCTWAWSSSPTSPVDGETAQNPGTTGPWNTVGSFTVTMTVTCSDVADPTPAQVVITVESPPPTACGQPGGTECGAPSSFGGSCTAGDACDPWLLLGTSEATFNAGATAVTACPTTLSASTDYKLTGNLGSDKTATCITLASGARLNLGGYTLTGRIFGNINQNGVRVFNGKVECTHGSNTSDSGCVVLLGSSTPTSTAYLHHLLIDNDYFGADQVRAMNVAITTSANDTYAVKMVNVEATVNATNGSTRAYAFAFTGEPKVGAENLKATVSVDADAAQGLMFFSSQRCTLANSEFHMYATTANRGRAVLFDANSVPSSDQTEATRCTSSNILVDVHGTTNRALRDRNRIVMHDGWIIKNCNGASGCVEGGDPDGGVFVTLTGATYANFNFQTPVGGDMFWFRNSFGQRIENATLTGSQAGRLLTVTTLAGGSGRAQATVVDSDAFSSTANIKAIQFGSNVTVIAKDNAGSTDATSTGTVVDNAPNGVPYTVVTPTSATITEGDSQGLSLSATGSSSTPLTWLTTCSPSSGCPVHNSTSQTPSGTWSTAGTFTVTSKATGADTIADPIGAVSVITVNAAAAPISRVGSCQGTTSCTPPAHQAGDLFIVFAGRNGSATAPTLPAGWTNVATPSINGSSSNDSAMRVACKVAAGSSETVTGFTNAGNLVAVVYRNTASIGAGTCATDILGTPATFTSTVNTTTTTLTYNGVTNQNAQSWVVGGGYSSAASDVEDTPSGMTNVTSNGTGPEVAVHDTNAAVSSFSTANVTNLNAAGRVISAVVEIKR